MNDKKTIIRPRGAFPDTMQGWADYEAQWESPEERWGLGLDETGQQAWDGDEGEEPDGVWVSGDDEEDE